MRSQSGNLHYKVGLFVGLDRGLLSHPLDPLPVTRLSPYAIHKFVSCDKNCVRLARNRQIFEVIMVN